MSLLLVYKFSSLKCAALPCKQKFRFLRTVFAYLKAIKKKKKGNNYQVCQSCTYYAWNSFLAAPHWSSHHLSPSHHPQLLQVHLCLTRLQNGDDIPLLLWDPTRQNSSADTTAADCRSHAVPAWVSQLRRADLGTRGQRHAARQDSTLQLYLVTQTGTSHRTISLYLISYRDLRPALEPSAQDRHGAVGAGPEEAPTTIRGGTPLLWGKAGRAGAVQPGEEKAPGRP